MLHKSINMLLLFGHVWLFTTPWTTARPGSLFFTISRSLVKFMSVESVMLSNHLILCRPFLLLPSIFPRMSLLFRIRWPKYWSFSFRISPSNDNCSWLISFRIDWFDLAIQFSSVMSDSLRPHGLQHPRPPCPSPTPEVYSNACLLSRWCHPSHPLSAPSPAFNLSQHQGLFQWKESSSPQVAKGLKLQLQHQSLQ